MKCDHSFIHSFIFHFPKSLMTSSTMSMRFLMPAGYGFTNFLSLFTVSLAFMSSRGALLVMVAVWLFRLSRTCKQQALQ